MIPLLTSMACSSEPSKPKELLGQIESFEFVGQSVSGQAAALKQAASAYDTLQDSIPHLALVTVQAGGIWGTYDYGVALIDTKVFCEGKEPEACAEEISSISARTYVVDSNDPERPLVVERNLLAFAD